MGAWIWRTLTHSLNRHGTERLCHGFFFFFFCPPIKLDGRSLLSKQNHPLPPHVTYKRWTVTLTHKQNETRYMLNKKKCSSKPYHFIQSQSSKLKPNETSSCFYLPRGIKVTCKVWFFLNLSTETANALVFQRVMTKMWDESRNHKGSRSTVPISNLPHGRMQAISQPHLAGETQYGLLICFLFHLQVQFVTPGVPNVAICLHLNRT